MQYINNRSHFEGTRQIFTWTHFGGQIHIYQHIRLNRMYFLDGSHKTKQFGLIVYGLIQKRIK